MNRLKSIIITELKMNMRRKSFILSSILLPLIIIISLTINLYSKIQIDESVNNQYLLGTSSMVFIWLFLLIYGAQLFHSVRYEKGNRIIEIISTSVKPHIFLLGKIISVGILGLMQIGICLIFTSLIINYIGDNYINLLISRYFLNTPYILPLFIFQFIGGYLIFGALYSIAGSITSADNDNQLYMILVTIILIISMYTSIYAIDCENTSLVNILLFVPFTAPIILSSAIFTGNISLIIIILSCVSIAIYAYLIIKLCGIIYGLTVVSRGSYPKISDIIKLIKR